ncbi:MAG TPA: zf-HC2 domain-containing protein, partial [Armatimonadota bacterium]|nr:zf-HC2 domain-containing protein [Armatimonadota bacterium]
MRCDQAQELFSDRLEGLLERPMAIAFDHHLSECSECSHQYGAFKTTWQMLESLPEVAPPPGFACDVMMKIQLQREAERRARSWWQTIWSEKFMPKIPARAYAGAFAAAAVVLAAVLLLPSSPQKTDIPATLKPAATTVDAPKPVPVEPGKLAAEAWLHSGLTIEFDGYKT